MRLEAVASETILEVLLIPQSPGGLTFSLSFEGHVPDVIQGLENSSEGAEFSMAQWYPKWLNMMSMDGTLTPILVEIFTVCGEILMLKLL